MTEPTTETTRMNPEVKTRWLEALRSGEYVQGREVLHLAADVAGPEQRFCCLGILCDLAYREGVVTRRLEPEGTHYRYGQECQTGGQGCGCSGGSTTTLPPEVVRWAGLEAAIRVGNEGNPTVADIELTVWNDGEQDIFDEDNNRSSTDFARIAELIEDEL